MGNSFDRDRLPNSEDQRQPQGKYSFPSTSWTLVVAASERSENTNSKKALEQLCQCYWYPIYAFIRRRGHTPEEAADLTQDFFLRILSGAFFSQADPGKGRFRSFLLGAVRNFLSDSNDRDSALKRGGGMTLLPFDFEDGELSFSRAPRHNETPERIFERNWASTVLENVIASLRDEFVREGKQEQFDRLKVFLSGSTETSYAELAAQLSISEAAIKSAIHRLRQRYRETLRSQIAATVADPAEVDEEIRFLLQASRTSKGRD